MDTDLIIEHSRARFEHATARRTLKEKYQARLHFGYNGGMFKATPDMISFLNLYGSATIVIEDLYENPIKVNAKELCQLMQERWQEQMNAWLIEYDQISKNR